jgi:hypothetical protein
MSTAVYTTGSFDDRSAHSAQQHFTESFDMDQPITAMSNYARIMHEHTKRQMDTASRQASRRTNGLHDESSSAMSSLTTENSVDSARSIASVNSSAS